MKNITNNTFLKIIFIIFLSIAIHSCNNPGCIESDDFGEYNTYDFKVYSNGLNILCYYDLSGDPSSPTNGSLFQKYYEAMCASQDSTVDKKNCGYRAQQLCKSNPLSSESLTALGLSGISGAEPNWVSSNGLNGVTIEEESQILVSAIGKINLGGRKNDQQVAFGKYDDDGNYIDSQAIHSTNNKLIIDSGSTAYFKFNGSFGNSNNYLNTNNLQTADYSDYRLNYFSNSGNIANGAKNILAHSISFPDNNDEFPNDKVPLILDFNAIRCEIIGTTDANLTCVSSSDNQQDFSTIMGYAPTDPNKVKEFNNKFSGLYKISNSSKDGSFVQDTNDGFIREILNKNEPGLEPLSLTNLRSGFHEIITDNKVYRVDFILTQSSSSINSSCKDQFKYKYGISGAETKMFAGVTANAAGDFKFSIPLVNKHVDGYKLSVKFDGTASDAECALKYSLKPYSEILIKKSGYLKFDYIKKFKYNLTDINITGGSGVSTDLSNCSIDHYIVNNNYISDSVGGPTKINYKMNATYQKQFVRKGQKLLIDNNFNAEKWKIRITNTGNEFTFKCGDGIYISVMPRPAVFCSNLKLKEYVSNNLDDNVANNYIPNLKQNIDTGASADYSKHCSRILKYDSSGVATENNDKFCPIECLTISSLDNESCKKTFNPASTLTSPYGDIVFGTNAGECNFGLVVPSCNYVSYANMIPYKTEIDSQNFKALKTQYSSANYPDNFKESYCNNCLAELKKDLNSTTHSPSEYLIQCYDLENYNGTMAELNYAIERANTKSAEEKFIGSAIDPLVVLKNKNLKALESFNGKYGNLYPLTYSDIFFKNKNPSYIDKKSYIMFYLLDDSYQGNFDFNVGQKYPSTTTIPSTRFYIETIREKNNGENLAVLLCKESVSSGAECQGNLSQFEVSKKFSNNYQHQIIGFNEGSSSSQFFANKNQYQFDSGILLRKNQLATDTSISQQHPYTECTNPPEVGDNYICFKDYENNTSNPRDPSNENKYRLAFKIIDDENEYNCKSISGNEMKYEDCTVASSGCDKVKIANYNYNTAVSTNKGMYCDGITNINSGINPCEKEFFCVNKYGNNDGEYDVTIRIKRKSQQAISRFIDSIIGPVLSQVDGYNIDVDRNYVQNVNVLQNIQIARAKFINSTDLIFLDTDTSKINLSTLSAFDSKIKKISLAKSTPTEPYKISIKADNENQIISYIALVGFGELADQGLNHKIQLKKCSYLISDQLYDTLSTQCLYRNNCTVTFDQTIFQNLLTALGTSGINCNENERNLSALVIYSEATRKLNQSNYVKDFYQNLANKAVYKNILSISIVLMFSFYGFGYLIGVSELKQSEIVDRLIKVAIIYLFCNPDFGWVWFEKFFVDGFKGGADYLTFTMASLFDDSEALRNALNTEYYVDKYPLFHSADKVIGLFVSNDTIHKKIAGLLFYKLFGAIYFYIIYLSVFNYIYAISNAVLLYLTSQVFTSVLFMLAPIFFIFLLFKQTKTYFDNWINSIIGFAFQQIFLIFTISLFNVFIYSLVKSSLGYRVCWDTIWRISSLAGSLSLFSFWTVSDAPSFLDNAHKVNFSGDFNKTTPSFSMIISFWSATLIMKSFVNSITDLASLLTGGLQASNLANGVKGVMENLQKDLSSKSSALYNKIGLKTLADRVDQKLFNSGDIAKQERRKQKELQKNEKDLRSKILNSANKAEKEFKINNLKAGDKMLKGEALESKLREVRRGAMEKVAGASGYKVGTEKFEKLMSSTNNFDSKGNFKFPQTDNVFNAIRMVAQNAISDRGGATALFKSGVEKAGSAAKSIADKGLINSVSQGATSAKNSAGNTFKNPIDTIKNVASNFKSAIKGESLESKVNNVDKSVSQNDIKTAMKDMNPEGRDKLVNDVRKGDVDVKTGNKESDKGGKPDQEKLNKIADRVGSYANKQNQKDRE